MILDELSSSEDEIVSMLENLKGTEKGATSSNPNNEVKLEE